MGYIEEIRRLVGTRPLVLAAAGALVLDSRGRLLLQRRTDDGLWGTPGGAVEPGESVEATVRREAMEETGLALDKLTLFGVFSGPEMFHVYPNGDQAAIVSVMFLARNVEGEPAVSDAEGHELRYFSVAELADLPINPPNKPILNAFVAWAKDPANSMPGP